MVTDAKARRVRPCIAAAMLLGHLVVFAVALAAWWPQAATSLPLTTHLYDAQLIVWVLAWVSHAVSTDPRVVFDANINWPAPMQLTGSEHFFSHQIVFSPLSWATADPILAANVTAWLWYPVGATLFALLGVDAARHPSSPGCAGACSRSGRCAFRSACRPSSIRMHCFLYLR